MTKRSASKRWLRQQSSDPFVKQRDQQGLRSRATFKLDELIAKNGLIPRGGKVLDLGAAPGGWAQRVAELVGPTGLVVAVDILDIQPLDGVNVIQGDICEPAVLLQVTDILGKNNTDLVLSDMAPNISGIRDADEANFMRLAETVLDVASQVLKADGGLILKLFQFAGTDALVNDLKTMFRQVSRRKPAASRKQSKEFYVVASGYKL